MNLEEQSDDAVLQYHAEMRLMVEADIGFEGHRLLGEQARRIAREVEDELTRRGIEFEPIAWPEAISRDA
jgi:hypothetical protein